MNRKSVSLSTKNMVSSSKGRNKVISCSTPEHEVESPSRDSDSICDSEAASPVPFFCTQDGLEGETDVVWNYYTPKADHNSTLRLKNSTPLSRKGKKIIKKTIIERPLPKRRALRSAQKKTELFQDLIELNQNIHKLIEKKSVDNNECSSDKQQSGSEDDIFSNSPDCSPKSGLKTNKKCLRKNILSSKFGKPESETALESDDSMNECLIKASQIVEENILKPEPVPSRTSNINYFQDSIDGLLNNIRMESPIVSKARNYESPGLKNDSFDSFVGNLNDSALERLTQMPAKNVTPVRTGRSKPTDGTSDWTLQELKVYESPSSKNIFGRHSSMPESPSIKDLTKPSTSGMIFGRHNSMPYHQEEVADPGDSPIRCTPEEIRKKHFLAREKLLAKRLLPFTCSQQSAQTTQNQSGVSASKKPCFQPKVASSASNALPSNSNNNYLNSKLKTNSSNDTNLKRLIEKKRQEALMKLKRKQSR